MDVHINLQPHSAAVVNLGESQQFQLSPSQSLRVRMPRAENAAQIPLQSVIEQQHGHRVTQNIEQANFSMPRGRGG